MPQYPLMPAVLSFPEPGRYLRAWNNTSKQFEYNLLLRRLAPLLYTRWLGTLTPGSKSSTPATFRDLNPSLAKNHRFFAYLGLYPGAFYAIRHPYDVKQLTWDESPLNEIVDEDYAEILTYEASPHDFPTFYIWIQPGEYPAIEAQNVSNYDLSPKVDIIAAKYEVRPHDQIPVGVINQLNAGSMPYIPIDSGGQW